MHITTDFGEKLYYMMITFKTTTNEVEYEDLQVRLVMAKALGQIKLI